MKKTHLLLFAALLLSGMFTACSSCEGTCGSSVGFLFKDGTSEWKIVIPEQAEQAEEYAASEFRDTVKKVSGTELPLVKTNVIPPDHAVVIGSLTSSPAIQNAADRLQLKKSKDDIMTVQILDGNLYLAANSPRAVMYSVYHFLQDQLGVRWYWAGDDGEYITKMKSYKIPRLSWHYQPVFRYREMSQCSCHGYLPTEYWMPKMGLNMGNQNGKTKHLYVRRAGTHSIGIEGKKNFKEHPEYFSFLDGRRVPEGIAGCWSNPGFTQMMVERLKKMSANADILNAFVFDTTLRCQCPECTKNPDVSGRWWNYYHKLTREVLKEYPDLRIAGLAYQEYRNVPQCDVHWLEYLEYCQYNRCYVHKLGDPNCSCNQKSLAELKKWQEKVPAAIYGYQFDIFNDGLMLPFWNMLADEAKYYAAMGVVRMKTEMPIPYVKNRADRLATKFRIAYYIYAKMIWDPSQDPNAILKDWCDHVYGAGAAPMYDYLTQFAARWDKMNTHISYFGASADGIAPKLLDAEFISFAEDKIKEAERLAEKSGDARVMEEIRIEKILFRQWANLWKITSKDHVCVNLPYFPAGTAFSSVPEVKVSGISAAPQTSVKIFWTSDALHLQAVCTGTLPKDSVTLKIDAGDGQVKFYTANASDPAVKKEKDSWTAVFAVPFKEITGSTPKNQDFWSLSLTRRIDGLAVCGFPSEKNSMASVIFSEKCKGQKLIWICSPHGKGVRFCQEKSSLTKRGWSFTGCIGPEEAEKLDYTGVDMILVETYQNKLTDKFYQEKIVPAVKNGAVLFVNAYYWCEDLDRKFGDPSFKFQYKDDISQPRKPTWFTDTSFAAAPNKLDTKHMITPAGVLLKVPPQWEILAKQRQKSTGTDEAFMIIRPVGKGAVFVTGNLYGDLLPVMDNVLEYSKHLKRSADAP